MKYACWPIIIINTDKETKELNRFAGIYTIKASKYGIKHIQLL